MKIIEALDIILGKETVESVSPRWRPLCRIGAVIGLGGATCCVLFFGAHAVRDLVSAPTNLGNWLFAAFIAFMGYKVLFQPLVRGVHAWTRRGQPRTPHVCTLPGEGLVLRRMFSREILFLLVWCTGWDIAAFVFLPQDFLPAVRDFATKGFQGVLVTGVVFPLIGLVITGLLVWKIVQRCQPTYEIRLLGGQIRENDTVTFDYRFRGDPEKVKSVQFVLTSANRAESAGGRVDDKPGSWVEDVTFDTLAACTAGIHTFDMPEIMSDCHDAFDYFLRANVTFTSGLKATSNYRIPLR